MNRELDYHNRLKDLKEFLESIGYEYVSGFKGASKPIKVNCNRGHLWSAKPTRIRNGLRCSTCNKISRDNQRLQEFKLFVSTTEYEYVGGFTNIDSKVTLKCPKGHIYTPIATNFKSRNHRCSTCAGNKKITEGEFKDWVHDNMPDYSVIGKFKNTMTPIKMRHNCGECGNTEFTTTPNKLRIKGTRCPKCSYIKRGLDHSSSLSRLVKMFKEVAPDYHYVSGYVNWTTKVKVHHDKCNKDIDIYPYLFGAGNRCNVCSLRDKQSKGERYVHYALKDLGIANYEYPKKAKYLFDESPNKLLRYDFGFQYKGRYIVIEYQGEQHTDIYYYYSTMKKNFEKALNKFAKQNLHDDMKRQYAKDNGWYEIEIPYTCYTQQEVTEHLKAALSKIGGN